MQYWARNTTDPPAMSNTGTTQMHMHGQDSEATMSLSHPYQPKSMEQRSPQQRLVRCVIHSQVRFGFMVGIGTGMPQLGYEEDVRSGDIVVSQPQESSREIIQYDLVKAKQGGQFDYRCFRRGKG